MCDKIFVLNISMLTHTQREINTEEEREGEREGKGEGERERDIIKFFRKKAKAFYNVFNQCAVSSTQRYVETKLQHDRQFALKNGQASCQFNLAHKLQKN